MRASSSGDSGET